jgi:hypothetical protein
MPEDPFLYWAAVAMVLIFLVLVGTITATLAKACFDDFFGGRKS